MTPVPESFRPEELALHGESLRRLARRLVRDGGLAEDLVQDAYAAALASPPRSPGALAAWLARVVRSRAAELRRGAERRALREGLAARPESAPETAAERLAVHGELLAAVGDLREPYRTAIVLRYYEDLPPREIARALGLPVKTVKTRLARALVDLRAALDARHDGGRRAWALALAPLAAPSSGAAPLLLLRLGLAAMGLKTLAAALIAALALFGIWSLRARGSVHEPRPLAAARHAPLAPSADRPETEQLLAVLADPPRGLDAPRQMDGDETGATKTAVAASASVPAEVRTLRGIVLSESGAPVAGVQIEAHSQEVPAPAWNSVEMSEKDGRFEFAGVPSETLLDLEWSWNFNRVARVLDVDPGAGELELRVAADAPEVRILGTVLDSEGKPVEAQILAGRPQDHQRRLYTSSATTGEFEITGRMEGIYTVVIMVPATFYSEPKQLSAGDVWDLGRIELQAGGKLVVRVESGSPALKASLSVYDRFDRFIATLPGDAASPSLRLQAGPHWLQVAGEGVASHRIPVQIRDGEDTPANVHLGPGVPCRISLAFDPALIQRGDWIRCEVAGAEGVVQAKEVWVRERGRASLETYLEPGTYSVRATPGERLAPAGGDPSGASALTVLGSGQTGACEVELR